VGEECERSVSGVTCALVRRCSTNPRSDDSVLPGLKLSAASANIQFPTCGARRVKEMVHTDHTSSPLIVLPSLPPPLPVPPQAARRNDDTSDGPDAVQWSVCTAPLAPPQASKHYVL
jgi:hypothetical protein